VRQVLAIAALLAAGAVAAAEAEEFRQLGPHVHGVSTLDIAVDGQAVSMELQSPGADIVGFENRPTTDDQKAAVTRAQQTLARPLDLFGLSAAARCVATNAASAEVFLQDGGAAPPTAPDASLFDRYVQQAAHSVFAATYALRCEHPEAITAIDFRFFDAFAGSQVVRVQVISKRGPFAFDATRSQPHVDVKGAFQ
jgi:hypothetical protein